MSTSPKPSLPTELKKREPIELTISPPIFIQTFGFTPNHWLSSHRASLRSLSVNDSMPENRQSCVSVPTDFGAPQCPAHHKDSPVCLHRSQVVSTGYIPSPTGPTRMSGTQTSLTRRGTNGQYGLPQGMPCGAH